MRLRTILAALIAIVIISAPAFAADRIDRIGREECEAYKAALDHIGLHRPGDTWSLTRIATPGDAEGDTYYEQAFGDGRKLASSRASGDLTSCKLGVERGGLVDDGVYDVERIAFDASHHFGVFSWHSGWSLTARLVLTKRDGKWIVSNNRLSIADPPPPYDAGPPPPPPNFAPPVPKP